MATLDEVFDTFWAAWPKRVKRQAAKDAMRWALHHYDDPPGELLPAMLRTIAWQKRFYGSPQFFPDPNKWILDMRWTDEEPQRISPDRTERDAKHEAAKAQQIEYWRQKQGRTA